MAGIEVSLQVLGDQILSRRLHRFEENLRDARVSVWPRVVRILSRSAGRAFSTEGASTGEPWEALKPATIAAKQRKGQDPRILRRTGRLYDSVVLDTGTDHIDERGPETLRWGTRVPYAGIHQSKGPRTRVPRRAFLAPNAADRKLIVKAVQAGLVKGE